MVSEITRFYCLPDMTSSSVLRQGALHALFHDGFWKSDHDFLIIILSNVLATMLGFRDNEVVLTSGYDIIVSPPPGGCCTHFFMTDSEKATITSWWRSIVTFYLGCIVSEITRFHCKPDMTSSCFLRQEALQAIFHDVFWKSYHDFLLAFYSEF